MLSKLLRYTYKSSANQLLVRQVTPKIVLGRYMDLIPASQYDSPFPKKFKLTYALKTYWEITPLIFVTCFAVGVAITHIIWAFRTKVDCVYSTHNRDCISRTMDLRHPPTLKMFVINQKYEPWPEMQDVLDKMRAAEKRALVRVQTCSLA